MKKYLVCLIHGVVEGTDSRETEPVKNQIKQLIRISSGSLAEEMIVLFQQPLRFQDSKEGIWCVIKWGDGPLPDYPEELKKVISDLLGETFNVGRVRVDIDP